MSPWALSPVPRQKPVKQPSLVTKIFGLRYVHQLGTLTTSFLASANIPIVQRSWGLLDDGNFYGPNFTFEEYLSVRNSAIGVAIHFATVSFSLALAIAPLRGLLKRFVYSPGQGPQRELANKDVLEYRAIGTADQDTSSPKRAVARFRHAGGIYLLTGLLMAEAAMVLLQSDELTKKLGGGVLTPATLGQPFIDRLRGAGVIIEAEMLPGE